MFNLKVYTNRTKPENLKNEVEDIVWTGSSLLKTLREERKCF